MPAYKYAADVYDADEFSPNITPSSSFLAASTLGSREGQQSSINQTSNEISDEGDGQATIPALTFTLANTILGAGVLGVAHSYATAGYALGLVLLFFSAGLSAFGLSLLQSCARALPGKSSFHAVAMLAMPALSSFIDLAVAIKCFGVSISYLIVGGDLMPTAMVTIFELDPENHSTIANLLRDRRSWVTLLFVCVAMPLACLKSLNSLRFTSAFSVTFICVLAVVVSIYAIGGSSFNPCSGSTDGPHCKGPTDTASFTLDTLKTLPVFIFSFTCAQNIFTVYNELQNHTAARVRTVIASAVSTGFMLYIIIAVMAYHTYGAFIESNLLINYPSTKFLAAMRILLSLNIAFTFPLQIHPCRASLLNLVQDFRARMKKREMMKDENYAALEEEQPGHPADPHDEDETTSRTLLATMTLIICACSYTIAMVVSNLGLVLGVVGATGSTLISYILPGACYALIYRERSIQRYLAMALCGYGLIVVPLCLTMIALGGSGH